MGTGRSTDISNSYSAVPVTPNDATEIPTTRALYIGVAGNVTVTMAYGQVVTFTAVANGILPVQVTKVMATGTAATNIVALY